MRRTILGLLPVLAILATLTALPAARARADVLPYKEGPVVDVTPIRVQDGRFYDYWNYLESHWKVTMEAAKKEGLVLSYSVLSATPRSPQEPNLYLVVTYPNYAAFDGIDEKMAVLDQKLFGSSPQKSEEDSGKRGPMRTVLGDEILRELQFKK